MASDDSAAPIQVLPPVAGSGTIVVVVDGEIDRADAPTLCDQFTVMLTGSDAELVVCDVSALVDPDIGTVDLLARLALTARRLGCQVRLRHPCQKLKDLVALVGLCRPGRPTGKLPLEFEG